MQRAGQGVMWRPVESGKDKENVSQPVKQANVTNMQYTIHTMIRKSQTRTRTYTDMCVEYA